MTFLLSGTLYYRFYVVKSKNMRLIFFFRLCASFISTDRLKYFVNVFELTKTRQNMQRKKHQNKHFFCKTH